MWQFEQIKETATFNPYTNSHGFRRAYKLFNTDIPNIAYVVADYALTWDRGPETMIFWADAEGEVVDWMDLWTDPEDCVSNDVAIKEFVDYLNTTDFLEWVALNGWGAPRED